jgi:serine/threonine protein kinase
MSKTPFGPGGKIIKDHTDAWCTAKPMRLRGRFDTTEEMDRYEEWRLATGLEAMDFKHPRTGEMRPYIVGGTLEEELESLPRELCSRECIEFILYLLELDYKKRPTALEALQHPFIKSTVTWQQKDLN